MTRPPSGKVASSFRDPSGFVFERDGTIYRHVDPSYAPHYESLLSSGLYRGLLERGLLVSHDEIDPSISPKKGAYQVIRPDRIPFVSYPYEWCFSQLRRAALTTLEIQELALQHGMSLRDASAYNIQLKDDRAILMDTLSFEKLVEGRPWIAYRQFCQHFLAPLALVSEVDPRLGQLARVHLDGIPLDLAATLLPLRTRARPSLMIHIHQHARAAEKYAHEEAPSAQGRGRFGTAAFTGLIESLRSAVLKLEWRPQKSEWSDYYEGDSYSDEAFAHKQRAVTKLVDTVAPTSAWDLGANTGLFARLTANKCLTVAFDSDVAAVEINFREMVARSERNLLPLVVDVTNPSPAIGWNNEERMSLRDRGPVDLVLALALVHHLAIGNNVPLADISSFLGALGRWLVIEFVPKSDPRVKLLLRSREDIFPDYNQGAFEKAFSLQYEIERREKLADSDRILYLMRRR